MKKLYSLILLILFLNTAAFSQSEWFLQYVGSLKSIDFININTGWAIGYQGIVLKTTNSGKNWIIQPKINSGMKSVQFLDMNTGMIVGINTNDSLILKTTNGGINWIPQSIENNKNISAIHFTDSNNWWATIGDTIVKTTNGGTNWINMPYEMNNSNFKSVFFIDQNTGWIGGDKFDDIIPEPIILKTTNGGTNWIYIYPFYSGVAITYLYFTDINTGYALDFYGSITKSTNGGIGWDFGINSDLLDGEIQFINNNTGWLTSEYSSSNGSSILKTTNGGANWSYLNNTPASRSACFVDSSYAWIVDTQGYIYSTYNKMDSNDVGVFNIINPIENSVHYAKCTNNDSIIPNVSIKNFGQKAQNNFFDVHFEIKFGNNIVYHSIKQATIDAWETKTINFDPYILNFDLQAYNNEKYKINSWTSLVTDTNPLNDTAESAFSVVNPNYAYSDISGYYFLNSSINANCIPDQPVYNWEDTTGSTSLIVNGQAVVPFAYYNSYYFNGCFRLPDALTGGDKFKFFGTCYDTILISTSGVIGFGGISLVEMSYPFSSSIPSVTAPHPAIFPFWYFTNFQDPEIIGRNLKYKVTDDKFIVTYDRFPLFNTLYDSNDYVSYQVILETGIDGGTENGNITVQFDNSKSGSLFLNNYYNGNLHEMTIGIQNSTGTKGLLYRRSEANHVVTVPGPLFGSPLAIRFGQINELLPVELESFISTVSENNVILNWRVTSEINNSGFDLERSNVKDQTSDSWIKIGNVAGNGNSNSPVSYTFEDKNLTSGKYKYRLKQIDFNGSFEYYDLQNEVIIGIPGKYNLSQNYPNPFNPLTKIKFEIPVDSKVVLKIYDNTGREMKTLVNEFKTAGYYSFDFNGTNLASGVYFYKLHTDGFSDTKRMILLK
ncbi:MAG: T9SS type A sorting domain-containing protein [Ignavibacteria bacterium]